MKGSLVTNTDPNNEMLEQVHRLFQNEWWSKYRSLSDTTYIIRNSQIAFI